TFGRFEVHLQLRRALDRRNKFHWSRRQSPRVWIRARVSDFRRIDGADLRAARFDRYHARNKLRTFLRDIETDSAALRVREQDDGFADQVEKCDAGRNGK